MTKSARAECLSRQVSSQSVCAVSASPKMECEILQQNSYWKQAKMQSSMAKILLMAKSKIKLTKRGLSFRSLMNI